MKIWFNTLAMSRKLAESGLPAVQSDAVASATNEAIDMAVSELATRADIGALREEVRQSIFALRTDVEKSLAVLRTDLDQLALSTRDEFKRLSDKIDHGQDKISTETKLAIADNRTLIAETKASLIEAMQRQMIWTVATMIAIGGTIIAVIRLG